MDILYNIFFEFGIAMKPVKTNKNESEWNLQQSPCRQTAPFETNTHSALLHIVSFPRFMRRHALDRLSITPFPGQASFIHLWPLVIRTPVE